MTEPQTTTLLDAKTPSTTSCKSKLIPLDYKTLTIKYGAGFCTCVGETVDHISPEDLAEYCERQGYKPFPPMITDDTGRRWAYLLGSQRVTHEGRETVINDTASFGDFTHFPLATAEGVLLSIAKLADYEKVAPVEIAQRIITARSRTTSEPLQHQDP